MKKIVLLIFGILSFSCHAQSIRMEFPHFAGKSYDFIIFTGTGTKKMQGTIPQDGKFTLSVPKEYVPYTGMSRWLITGTQEGGGLDMLIPGHDFSVSCTTAAKPDDKNIIYTGNTDTLELHSLYKKQQDIFSRHNAMLQATKAYPKKDKNYPVFEKEYQHQLKAYESFQQGLDTKDNYPARFINIVNITQGIGTKILNSEEEKAKNIADYILQKLDWQTLYTSGHWYGVISSWASLHSQVLNDPQNFAADFASISKKISNKEQYTDFAARVAYTLTQNGKEDFIKEVTPMVVASGKVLSYEGSLAVYVAGTQGSQAPDLDLTAAGGTILKSKDFSRKEYTKTVLLFYRSDCGACAELLEELPGKYEALKSSGVRVIPLSADEEEAAFKDKAKSFPWKDVYHDKKGLKGINFTRYGVKGTPTIFLLDNVGKILLRTVSLEQILEYLKIT